MRRAFSLVELLVVIGIIVLLIAILLPVVNTVRAASRSTKCLANLQQWGHSYQMYLSANGNQPISEVKGATHLRWWEVLNPYNGNVRKTLLCPEAHEPRTDKPAPDGYNHLVAIGGAFNAWRTASKWSQPRDVNDDYFGSYCINVWTNHHPFPNMKKLYISFPVRHAEQVPLLGDGVGAWAAPTSGDPVPLDLIFPDRNGGSFGGITGYCIDRHRMAVNIVFLDGHGEHVGLSDLWQLRWQEISQPHSAVVPRQ